MEYSNSLRLSKSIRHIISEGGGSTIDVGKWLAHKYELKHTAIPTTAGTGSEVTRYAVLTTGGRKKTYEVKKPDSYVLDPRLVTSLPILPTVSSGLDTLSQALESLWSKNATPDSKSYSCVALQLTLTNLPKCVRNLENEEYRMNMLIAANMAGRAIEITKTNVCHAISYPLTDIYKIPHGIACAMSLRYFTKKALGIDLSKWLRQFHLPKYQIDKNRVLLEVVGNPKLADFPTKIYIKDILKAICVV